LRTWLAYRKAQPAPAAPKSALQTAERALRCLAAQMSQDGTRDLQWWQICD